MPKKSLSTNDKVKLILSLPEYKGRAYFKMCEIARIYFNGNEDRARAFVAENNIAPTLEPYGSADGKRGRKMYNIFEVQEAVDYSQWDSA